MTLERLDGFEDPAAAREQYVTPPSLASHLLTLADRQGDLEGLVVDLGCGTGVLGVGAAVAGARAVGVDVDAAPLAVARRNAARLEVASATSWVLGDVATLPLDLASATVVMNPPFGAQRRGADRPFLSAATEIADAVYSIHNAGSRSFVEAYVDGEITHAYEASLTIPHRFDFHDEERREISVEVYRIDVR